ncbi:MAG: hypothetical protein JSW26_31315 [Desulfobacterales bacterium]|nr:MAG: hypothetical protein JSW26_31315 [Desulfobacterales bacterium]
MRNQFFMNSNAGNFIRSAILTILMLFLSGRLCMAGQSHAEFFHPASFVKEYAMQEKIEAYKKFKAKHEDKDFQLKATPVTRTEQGNGTAGTYSFNVYNIDYGITEDNFREYNPYSKQIVRNPMYPESDPSPVCQSGLFVREYGESGNIPQVICAQKVQHSYAISLIMETFSQQELENVVTIYEFSDGDVDIRFSFSKSRDKEFVERLYKKLKDADEHNDALRPEVKMQPVIPTDNQRVTAVFLDEDEDGEPEFVFLPYCIDGSFFDQDPHNNSFQVGLKYKLVTQKDLAGKTIAERKALEERLGLWMYDKPSEVLASFSENPGPDIVFYDVGKVVNSEVVDTRPDGKFDRYEFLF